MRIAPGGTESLVFIDGVATKLLKLNKTMIITSRIVI